MRLRGWTLLRSFFALGGPFVKCLLCQTLSGGNLLRNQGRMSAQDTPSLISDQAVLDGAIQKYNAACEAQKRRCAAVAVFEARCCIIPAALFELLSFRRAERFGTEYSAPDAASLQLPLHLTKRLGKHLRQKATRTKSAEAAAITAAEKAERDARRRRFAAVGEDSDDAAPCTAETGAVASVGDAVGIGGRVSSAGAIDGDEVVTPAAQSAATPAADAVARATTQAGSDSEDEDVDLSGGIVPAQALDSIKGGAGAAALGQVLAQEIARRRARAEKFGQGLSPEDDAVFQAALVNLGTGLLLSAPPGPPAEDEAHKQEQEVGTSSAAAALLADADAAVVIGEVEGQQQEGLGGVESGSSDSAKPHSTAENLDSQTTAAQGADSAFAVRKEALHVRGPGYLPLGTRDLMSFFSPCKPSCVEWLNGVAVNVLFSSGADAGRALARLTCTIPRPAQAGGVEGGQSRQPHTAWRVSAKPLRKGKTDKWGMRGDAVTVYVRYATDCDLPGKCKGTSGARTYGTWGKKAMERITLTSASVGFQQAVAGQVGALPAGSDIRIQMGAGGGRSAKVGGGKRRRIFAGAQSLQGDAGGAPVLASALQSALSAPAMSAQGVKGVAAPPSNSRKQRRRGASSDAASPARDPPGALLGGRRRMGGQGGVESAAAAAAAKQALAAAAASAGPTVPHGPRGSDATGSVPTGQRVRTIVRKAQTGTGRLSIQVGSGGPRKVVAPPTHPGKTVITVTKRAAAH